MGMDTFLTWEFLLTVTGCTLGTGILVQLLKQYVPMPTQLFSYIVAFVVLNGAAFFTGIWNPAFMGISVFNAGIVALTSNGGFEGATKLVEWFKSLLPKEMKDELSNNKGDAEDE